MIEKLEYLLKSKVESIMKSFFENKDVKISQANLSLLNTMVQMMGIVD